MDSAIRKDAYPIQPSETSDPVHPPDNHNKNHKQTLPRTIRALKNAKHSPNHERTLVICLDGTVADEPDGDQFDADNSNVVHFVSCLKKHTRSQQQVYYQSGIGTYDRGGLRNGIGAAMDMAVGSGLGIHIKDAYRFLMQNYQEGDKICLLGFSRGAYTVRCLSGMLHKVGLLPASNGSQVNFAYEFYKDDTPEGWKMSAEFKRTFCTDVNVYFLGLWDCVASVGFVPRKLPFSKSATNTVRYFRHAMALDEHRSKFKVCQWQHENPDLKRADTFDATPKAQMKRAVAKTGLFGMPGSTSAKMQKAKMSAKPEQKDERSLANATEANGHAPEQNGNLGDLSQHLSRKEQNQEKLEAAFNAIDAKRKQKMQYETDALEVWFQGAHADCGGGAVANEERHKLAQIPLRWMIRQCFDCNTGILFDTTALADMGLDLHTLYPHYESPQVPRVGPAPTLMEQYEKGTLPPLRKRSILFRIGKGEGEEECEELDDMRDHQDKILPESCEDWFDSMSPVNDQLVVAKGWWILEVWPVKVRVRNSAKDGWEKKVRFNMGRHRAIRESRPNLHWTVQRLIDEKKYNIKCRMLTSSSWNIVA